MDRVDLVIRILSDDGRINGLKKEAAYFKTASFARVEDRVRTDDLQIHNLAL
jgi:hypothetical protein